MSTEVLERRNRLEANTIEPSIKESLLHLDYHSNIKSSKPGEKGNFVLSFEFQSYHLLLRSLSFLGIYYPKHPNTRFEPISVISAGILHLIFIYRVILVISSFGSTLFWANAVDLLRALASVNITLQLMAKQTKLHQCLFQTMPVIKTAREKMKHRFVNNVVNTGCLSAWIYILARILMDIYVVSDSSGQYFDGFIKVNLFDLKLAQSSTNYALVYILIILDRVLTTGPTSFSIIFYLLLCVTSFNQIRLYNHFFKLAYESNMEIDTLQLRRWLLNRVHLSMIVEQVEDLMSNSVFLWYCLYFMGFCFKVLAVFEHDPMRPEWAKLTTTILDLGYINFCMITVSIIGSYVTQTAKKSPSLVHQYISAQSVSSGCHLKHQSHLLVLAQTDPLICVTGGGVFNLSKGLVVSVWGSVGTYLLIIISWRGVG